MISLRIPLLAQVSPNIVQQSRIWLNHTSYPVAMKPPRSRKCGGIPVPVPVHGGSTFREESGHDPTGDGVHGTHSLGLGPEADREAVRRRRLDRRRLLARFLAGRGEVAESAFATIVERHGPMVLRVCRILLGDAHEAEDAAQATFLALARRAGSLRNPERLANWLYGVAHRTAPHRAARRGGSGRARASAGCSRRGRTRWTGPAAHPSSTTAGSRRSPRPRDRQASFQDRATVRAMSSNPFILIVTASSPPPTPRRPQHPVAEIIELAAVGAG